MSIDAKFLRIHELKLFDQKIMFSRNVSVDVAYITKVTPHIVHKCGHSISVREFVLLSSGYNGFQLSMSCGIPLKAKKISNVDWCLWSHGFHLEILRNGNDIVDLVVSKMNKLSTSHLLTIVRSLSVMMECEKREFVNSFQDLGSWSCFSKASISFILAFWWRENPAFLNLTRGRSCLTTHRRRTTREYWTWFLRT